MASRSAPVLECTPAAYINLAANEAEKAAPVNLMHVSSVGVFGRLWMAGTESDILAARDAAVAALESIDDVLTHEAAQRARDLGVAVEREQTAGWTAPAAAPTASAPPASAPAGTEQLRAAVRAAVVAELGTEPPTLDAVIDRVLRSRP